MFTLALALSLFAAHAEAAPRIQPAPGEKVCLAREYTAGHMQRNPKQHLNKMHVLLETKKGRAEEGGDIRSAKVVGEKDGVLYGNEATCEFKAGGVVHCFIECDGGSFNLHPSQGQNVLFRVTEDYYFPLYRKGADPENRRDEDTLSFDFKDRDNNIFRLEKSSAGVCEKQWKAFKEVPAFGC